MALSSLRRYFRSATVEMVSLDQIGPGVAALSVRYLEPRESIVIPTTVTDPSFRQEAVVVNVFSILRQQKRLSLTPFCALEAPDHCLGRMFERSPNIDASAALHEAGSAFMALNVQTAINIAFRRETVVLPAGPGFLLSNAILGQGVRTGLWRIFARARTYITADMAAQDQRPLEPAEHAGLSVLSGGWSLLGTLRGDQPLLTDAQLATLAQL